MGRRKGRKPRHDAVVVVPAEARERFVLEYIKTWNCSHSAVAAGYTESTGHAMLREPEVIAAIEAAVRARNEALRVDAEWVLSELLAHYNFTADRIVDAEGKLDLSRLSREELRFIDAVEVVSSGGKTITKVRLADKTKLLDIIGKHVKVGAFRADSQPRAPVTIHIEPEDAQL